MYDCYLLKGEILEKVSNKLGSRLIQGNYEYFLEAAATEKIAWVVRCESKCAS